MKTDSVSVREREEGANLSTADEESTEWPCVAIVILTWNQCSMTLDCLNSLAALQYPADRLQIIVVDNGSTDSTAQILRSGCPTATVLETGENLGYAGGNNVGIQYALDQGTEYVLVLNNDVLVASDAVSELVCVSEREPLVGFLGPKVYHREEPQCLQSAGIVLDRLYRFRHRGQGQVDVGQFESVEKVDAVSGCAILTSRQVLEQIGLIDPEFFMYHEDIDWCLRAKAAGFRNLYVPAAKVWHRKPQLRSATAALTTYYMTRNMYLLLSKHRAGVRPFALATVRNLIWLLNWTFNPKWRGNREKRDALFKALVDAATKDYGKSRDHIGY